MRNVIVVFFIFPALQGPETLVFAAFLIGAKHMALLKSPHPLKQTFTRWENKETSHMENIWDTVQEQAKTAETRQKAKAQKER